MKLLAFSYSIIIFFSLSLNIFANETEKNALDNLILNRLTDHDGLISQNIGTLAAHLNPDSVLPQLYRLSSEEEMLLAEYLTDISPKASVIILNLKHSGSCQDSINTFNDVIRKYAGSRASFFAIDFLASFGISLSAYFHHISSTTNDIEILEASETIKTIRDSYLKIIDVLFSASLIIDTEKRAIEKFALFLEFNPAGNTKEMIEALIEEENIRHKKLGIKIMIAHEGLIASSRLFFKDEIVSILINEMQRGIPDLPKFAGNALADLAIKSNDYFALIQEAFLHRYRSSDNPPIFVELELLYLIFSKANDAKLAGPSKKYLQEIAVLTIIKRIFENSTTFPHISKKVIDEAILKLIKIVETQAQYARFIIDRLETFIDYDNLAKSMLTIDLIKSQLLEKSKAGTQIILRNALLPEVNWNLKFCLNLF
ncbi:MAG: hypothetical protein ABIA04_07680 [Pseudomonadota bacterium]